MHWPAHVWPITSMCKQSNSHRPVIPESTVRINVQGIEKFVLLGPIPTSCETWYLGVVSPKQNSLGHLVTPSYMNAHLRNTEAYREFCLPFCLRPFLVHTRGKVFSVGSQYFLVMVVLGGDIHWNTKFFLTPEIISFSGCYHHTYILITDKLDCAS